MVEFSRYRCRHSTVAALIVTLVFDRTYCSNTANLKNNGVDVFDLLLGLYKLNPLKGSKVYSKFANNVLTQYDKRSYNVKLSSNENKTNQKISFQQIKDIEKIIHPIYKKQMRHSMEKPEFDVENVNTENFNIDVIIRDNFENELRNHDKYANKNILDRMDIGSNENIFTNYTPKAKSLPANQWLLPNSIKYNPAPTGQWFIDSKDYDNEERFKQVEVPNKFQEPSIISDNILTQDVVVL